MSRFKTISLQISLLSLAACTATPGGEGVQLSAPPAAKISALKKIPAEVAAWPARKASHAPDMAEKKRIAEIIAGMTLEQKIGQITQAEICSIKPEEVRQYYIGSILNGGGAWPGMNQKAPLEDWVKLAAAYDEAALASDMKTPIPLIWGTDAVHGHNNVYGATMFPHNIGLGAAHDPALVERIGRATARQVRATGIGWVFAPTLAVVQNQRWGRSYEGYSSDPEQVSLSGAALVRGLQGTLTGEGDVLATAKHFVGDGGTYQGVDQGENRSSAEELAKIHGAGYYAALDEGAESVMISYNSWTRDGTVPYGKAHGSYVLVTSVLKERLQFDGLVVSDWNAIEQVDGCAKDHCPQAVNAGVDLFMVPDDWKSFIEKTTADVREGRIPMQRIDDAVARNLHVKMRMGLFDRPISDSPLTNNASALVDRPLAQEAVRKSVVLLKNNAALPLTNAKKILVVGKAADSFPQQAGGWSITWQGDKTDNSDYPVGETLLSGLQRVFGKGNVQYSPDGAGVDPKKFDAIIAVLGEQPYAEMKGDVVYPAPLAFSPRYPEEMAVLGKVSGKGVPVTTVLYSGRTQYTTDLINRSDAFVAAFLPGTEAGALADLLAGREGLDFQGRLSFAWPNTPCPVSGEAKAESLFMRGFGLSYAKSYAKPQMAKPLDEIDIPQKCN